MLGKASSQTTALVCSRGTLIAMRRIPLLLAGLIAVVAICAVACSDDSAPEQEQQEQAQTVSAEQQQDIAQQTQHSQQQQTEQREQLEAVEAVEDQKQEQASQTQPEQAETSGVEQEESQQEQQERQDAELETKLVIGGERPATLLLPQDGDRSEPRPLVLLLHGYGSFAGQVDQYFRFSRWVDKAGFGLLLPDGTRDRNGVPFWNGTNECCDLFDAEPDDVGYLKALIEEAREQAAFDRVYAVGHSNGGFMAYRLACENVPGLTGIVSLAGGAFSRADDCRVPTPLSVLQIHGTEDDLVLYEPGRLPTHPDPDREPVPGAWGSVTRWAERAGCNLDAVGELPPIDTDSAVDGDETTIKRYSEGCVNGAVMELWTIEGGGHVPIVWDTDFTPQILAWIAARHQQATTQVEQVESPAATVVERVIGGEREARLLLPGTAGSEPIPLIVSLHGYQGEAEAHDWYFGLSSRIIEYNFALITPQGTVDERGNSFWNATDGCCNFHGSEVDDYGWLSSLVVEAREIVEVSGVYVVGYSNGGFMSYRLACDGLNGLAGIVSLAGSSYGDPERCADAGPLSVLQIHGADDINIPYDGTLEYDGGYPGAVDLIDRWGERAGCDLEAVEELPSIDLETTIAGAETTVQRLREGCADGITIELWTIEGGDHFPLFRDDWPDHLLNWLFNESRAY